MNQFLPFWESLTEDRQILQNIKGVKIKFTDKPKQYKVPKPYKFSSEIEEKIDKKIEKYLKQNIMEIAEHDENEFISNIFIKEKPDGDIRILINLDKLNDFIEDEHFKMEDVQAVMRLIKQNCYMASVDFKDAYYCVKVDTKYRKFLRFIWKGKLIQYTCLPNGIKNAPRVFTKTTKPVIRKARENEAKISTFLDDSFIEGDTLIEARKNVMTIIDIAIKAGYIPHPIKSKLDPKQILIHLGFIFNSINMTVRITEERVQKILELCKLIISKYENKQAVTIKKLASLSGCIVASFPGNQYGKLMYRTIDNFKIEKLRENKFNYHAKIYVNKYIIEEIKTCMLDLPKSYAPIIRDNPKISLESDSSDIGWGGLVLTKNDKTGGSWTKQEIALKNNYLELKAACFAILSLCKNMKNTHILIKSDNTTAVGYLNHQGGRKFKLNKLAKDIWLWAKQNQNWITAEYIPGKENLKADKISRTMQSNLEWSLDYDTFEKIIKKFGKPKIDLFASRLNNKLPKYYAWKPDPNSIGTNAFLQEWGNTFAYAFPPFNQIGKTIQKAIKEKTKLILVCPNWPSQPWYSVATQLAKQTYFFSRKKVSNPVGKVTGRNSQDLPETQFMALLLIV